MHPLIVISHPSFLPNEASIIQQLFVEGLQCFHLRKPQASEEEVRQLLDAIPAEYYDRIALHAFHHLADEYDIKRLHYTEQVRTESVGRPSKGGSPFKKQGYILSTSVHSLQSLQSLSTEFSYAFFGPVFNSISKQNYAAIAGKDFYIRDDEKAVPAIALGGINAENIGEVMAMNFDGVAVLGFIWEEQDRSVEKFRLIQNTIFSQRRKDAKV